MTWNETHSLADRFAWLIDGLCTAIGIGAQKRGIEAALAWAIWIRVRLLGDRLIALAERARAGWVQAQRPGGGQRRAAGPRAPRSPQGRRAAVAGLPQDFGWVERLLPETAQYAGMLRYMLREPEMAALVEQAPQTGRVLRPLCHLLGVPAPDFLLRRADAALCAADGAAAPPPSRPAPVEGEGEAAAPAPEAPETPPQPAPAPVVPWYERPDRPGGLYWDGKRLQWS